MQRSVKPIIKQKGAAAIEAALLFVIFFVLFYGIVGYSLPIMMKEAFQHAAANGARSALAVEPDSFASTSDYIDTGVTPRVRQIVGESLSWLPSATKATVLGPSNQNVQVNYTSASGVLTVIVSYTDYKTSPLVPVLTFPGIGDVPKLPDDIAGTAMISL